MLTTNRSSASLEVRFDAVYSLVTPLCGNSDSPNEAIRTRLDLLARRERITNKTVIYNVGIRNANILEDHFLDY